MLREKGREYITESIPETPRKSWSCKGHQREYNKLWAAWNKDSKTLESDSEGCWWGKNLHMVYYPGNNPLILTGFSTTPSSLDQAPSPR